MKNYFFTTIIISIVFGLGSGLAAYFIGSHYFNYDLSGFALTREFNLMDGASNLVIRDARKVIINQDDKSAETIDRVKNNLFSVVELEKDSEYLNFNNSISRAMLLTNDGWLLTIIENFNEDELISDLRIIDRNRNIYPIEDYNLIFDKVFLIKINNIDNAYIFNNLNYSNLKAGQSMIGFTIDGKITSTFLNEKITDQEILNSDKYIRDYDLVDNDNNYAFVFNIIGDFVGLSSPSGLYLANTINNKWLSSISENEFITPSLNINYLDLSKTIFLNEEYPEKGALIYPQLATSSPAYLAGLRVGDIILRVNGQELNQNNNLSELILQQSANDKVYLQYLRQGKEEELTISLKSQINEN
jgi:hypothetical protein